MNFIKTQRACFLIGSNLGDRLVLISKAIGMLHQRLGDNIKVSGVYATAPWGTLSPEEYLNIAISLDTHYSPLETMQKALQIERELGRIRTGILNEPRSIDIDLVLFGAVTLNTEVVTVPHPRMHLRKFVLLPLSEIEPHMVNPVLQKTVGEMLAECTDNLPVEIFTHI